MIKIDAIIKFMNKESIKEKIGIYKTFATVFWTSAFILGGGLYHMFSTGNIRFLFSIGCILEFGLFILSVGLMIRCRKLTREL